MEQILSVHTKEQKQRIFEILSENKLSFWLSDYGDKEICGIHLDDFVTFDQMAKIVDYVRSLCNTPSNNNRWIREPYIKDMSNMLEDRAIAFIESLGALGYDTNILMNEYKQTKKITL